jgi:hypothetical protein
MSVVDRGFGRLPALFLFRLKAGVAMARAWLTTDYDDRERYDANGLPYVRSARRQYDDPTADEVAEREQREIEMMMRHPAYRRERGRVRQLRQG